jgi:hypothetical protein
MIVGACTEMTDSTTIAGQYTLLRVNDTDVSGAEIMDSVGTVVTLDAGSLTLCGDRSYSMEILRQSTDGQLNRLVLSEGYYTWNGTTLTLVKSAGLEADVSEVRRGTILVVADAQKYEFYKLVQLPPRAAPECN